MISLRLSCFKSTRRWICSSHDLDAADPEQLTNILRTGALLEGQVMRVQAEYLGSEHEKEPLHARRQWSA